MNSYQELSAATVPEGISGYAALIIWCQSQVPLTRDDALVSRKYSCFMSVWCGFEPYPDSSRRLGSNCRLPVALITEHIGQVPKEENDEVLISSSGEGCQIRAGPVSCDWIVLWELHKSVIELQEKHKNRQFAWLNDTEICPTKELSRKLLCLQMEDNCILGRYCMKMLWKCYFVASPSSDMKK